MGELSARDRGVLDVELAAWSSTGAKEEAVRERLDLSPTRYYQVLNALIDDAAAVAAEPVLLGRLRRLRERRSPAGSASLPPESI